MRTWSRSAPPWSTRTSSSTSTTRPTLRATADSAFAVYPLTVAVTYRAMEAIGAYHLSLWDALIWAAARENGDPLIYTEDAPGVAGGVLDGIRYVNPFAPPPTPPAP